jgi:hypothetical protein
MMVWKPQSRQPGGLFLERSPGLDNKRSEIYIYVHRLALN